jgi:hypothetical protein
LLLKQAQQCYKHQLFSLAPKEFIAASVLAFDQQDQLRAVKQAKEANQALQKD